ncbi:unnamed protein product [Thelazia callipaeda]|uniref:LRRNT domain-containing protein n=1 Tax=Thelazia callipaeda TaxID=103827 RepID=A0A0N5CPM5_THECL|nr:unnamed protein product [Thelazia callipaeda]
MLLLLLRTVVVVVLLNIETCFQLTHQVQSNKPCPHLCSCSQDTVICTGQGLSRIPSGIPSSTIRLYVLSMTFFLA